MLRIGTAGWAIRREHAAQFPGDGSHLTRYAARLNAVEINSSFYRPHRPATYAKWARETPKDFAFSVKMPKAITHEARLKGTDDTLHRFLDECGALGSKLGCILIQLPPSLKFERGIAETFFADLRASYSGNAACEPRHASWFTPDADALLIRFHIARVVADPAIAKTAAPTGGFQYWRLHGSPRIYYSNYENDFLRGLAQQLTGRDAWCIFDNTALGFATANALELTSAMTCRRNPHRASPLRPPAEDGR
ncbi:MAG TPA: DUF72 domain-containing protein [Rhizomicrobium sp.]|jgi:uncharacterized protein YecE (DUF72 family)